MGTANLFVWCFFGKMATDSYAKIADHLYESNWPDLLIEFERYIIIMIANASQPQIYDGYGIATLDLKTFSKVKEFDQINMMGLIRQLMVYLQIYSFSKPCFRIIWHLKP